MKKFPTLLIACLLVLLIACTSTGETETAVSDLEGVAPVEVRATVTTLPEATETSPPIQLTPTMPPPPTVTAVPTEPALPQPPAVPSADAVIFGTDGYMAFVQAEQLFIQDLARAHPPILVDSCVGLEFCSHNFMKWSPDGQHLLYYRSENFESSEIRLATPDGRWQTIGTDANFIQPAAWSPDGRAIVYLRDTGEMVEVETYNEAAGEMMPWLVPALEVMTVQIEDGVIGQPEVIGPLTLAGNGCGGGGRSPSEVLYENEGGTAYGYHMGVLDWTAQDILLYTHNCTNIGVGRYDLANAAQLEPFDIPVRSLVLSPDKRRWYAVSGHSWSTEPGNNELVTGVPEETAVTIIPTDDPVEMAFMGEQSGQLYFTTRTLLREEVIDNGMGGGFRFYETTLWQMDTETGLTTAVYQAEDHAFAQVQEAADGTLLFVRIENDVPLMEATEAGMTEDQRPDYLPKRHIVTLDEAGELLYLVPDAGSTAVTP